MNRLDKIQEEIIIDDLPVEEILSKKLVKIDEKVSFKIKYIPSKLVKEKHIQYTYKSKETDKSDKEIIITSPHYTSFPKTMVDSSLVSHLIIEKFAKYISLYRQEKLFRNIGLDISRANLSNWFLAETNLLKPLVDLMHDDLLKQDIIHMDETKLQVIQTCKSQCYIWGMSSSKHDLPIRLYFYMNSREHENARILVKDFKGYIQSDCYKAYDKINGTIHVACIAHARRKFAKIINVCDGKLTSINSLCVQTVNFFKSLYKIEKQLEKD